MAYRVDDIIKAYDVLVKGIEAKADSEDERAYGGIIRSGKGFLVESIAHRMVEISWKNLKGKLNRLSLARSTFKIPLNKKYIDRIKYKEVREYITSHSEDYYYRLKIDIPVSIDNIFIMGIECKAYTENAMIKRILVDFTLLKTIIPSIKCVLIQLESQLTGDYSEPLKRIKYGSPSTHTLLSYFDVDLNIITLLEGERKVDEPIHKPQHYKELKKENLESGIKTLQKLLSIYR